MSSYFDLPRASSSAYKFTSASQSRAVPLSAALLRQNPALESALRRFESSALTIQDGYVVPRAAQANKGKAPVNEDYEWADDEMEEDEEESVWGDDDSEAGDEWETRDGLLVLSSSPSSSSSDLLPHPRPDFLNAEEEDVYPATPELETPLRSLAAYESDSEATLVSSASSSDVDDLPLPSPAFEVTDLSLRRTEQITYFEGFSFKAAEQKEAEADDLLNRALAFASFAKQHQLSSHSAAAAAAPTTTLRAPPMEKSSLARSAEGEKRWTWERSEEVNRLVALAQA